jgi:hypothetical protein
MGYVGFTAGASLAGVGLLAEYVGPVDGGDLPLAEIGLQQAVEIPEL